MYSSLMEKQKGGRSPYLLFWVMITASTVVIFCLRYFNVFRLDHVFFSRTRLYLALMMGAAMAIVMLLFMWKMYKNMKANLAILLVSAVVFAGALFLVRSQTTVGDVSWMRAMIPHHSIAILTSSRANLEDPRVRALADDIIEAQQREIEEMKELIRQLEQD